MCEDYLKKVKLRQLSHFFFIEERLSRFIEYNRSLEHYCKQSSKNGGSVMSIELQWNP